MFAYNIIQDGVRFYLVEVWSQSLDIDITQKVIDIKIDRQNIDIKKDDMGHISISGGTDDVPGDLHNFNLKLETEVKLQWVNVQMRDEGEEKFKATLLRRG